ncbi:MAG: AAA family ATPase [Selenomonadaceae bacterium]|nr:AAA family ATPase [Selenomonadaceae bacterium]
MYRTLSEEELQESLSTLMEYLSRFHHCPILLLIDEYDAPMQFAWDNGYYEDAIAFFRNFLSAALKTNPHLDFAVMTGVLRIAKESIFSSLNNLKVASVASDGAYADVMGFTRQEVRQMAVDFGCPEKIPEIRQWYDGYNFSDVEIYNPWSVINYFENSCNVGLYWVNTSGNSILAELLRHASTAQVREIHALMDGNPIYATLDEGVIYAELHENLSALYSVLLTTGYLTLDSRPNPYNGDSLCSMRIPNQEIRMLYKKEILRHMERMASRPNLMNEMLSGILSDETSKFAEGFATYLESMASFHDTANKETFYHGLMLGLLTMLIPRYRVVSNRESGYGRFDIAVFPKQNQSPGMLMEFKVATTEADLPAKARDALTQIDHMDYLAEFRAQGVEDIWKYGVAFCGKKVWIEASTSL